MLTNSHIAYPLQLETAATFAACILPQDEQEETDPFEGFPEVGERANKAANKKADEKKADDEPKEKEERTIRFSIAKLPAKLKIPANDAKREQWQTYLMNLSLHAWHAYGFDDTGLIREDILASDLAESLQHVLLGYIEIDQTQKLFELLKIVPESIAQELKLKEIVYAAADHDHWQLVYDFLGKPPASLKKTVDDDMADLLDSVFDGVYWDDRAKLYLGAIDLLKVDAPYHVDGTLTTEQKFHNDWKQSLAINIYSVAVENADGSKAPKDLRHKIALKSVKYARENLDDQRFKGFLTRFLRLRVADLGFKATLELGKKHLADEELVTCFVPTVIEWFNESAVGIEGQLAAFEWLLKHDRKQLLQSIVYRRGRSWNFSDSYLVLAREFDGLLLESIPDDKSFLDLPLNEQAMICLVLDMAPFETSLRFEKLLNRRTQKQINDLEEVDRALFRLHEAAYYKKLAERIDEVVVRNEFTRAERIVNALTSEAGKHYCLTRMYQKRFEKAVANADSDKVKAIREHLRSLAKHDIQDELYENLYGNPWSLTNQAELILHDEKRLQRYLEKIESESDAEDVIGNRHSFLGRLADVEWSMGMEMQAFVTRNKIEVDEDSDAKLQEEYAYDGFDAMVDLMKKLKMSVEDQHEFCLDYASERVSSHDVGVFDYMRKMKKQFPDLEFDMPNDTEFYYSRDSRIFREDLEDMCLLFPKSIYWRLSLAEYHATYGDPGQGIEIAQNWLVDVDGKDHFHMDRFFDEYFYSASCYKGFHSEVWRMVEKFPEEFEIEEIRDSAVKAIRNNESFRAALEMIESFDDDLSKIRAMRKLATDWE